MADEAPLDMDTPWRRSLDEIEPALSAWALARFAEPVAVANVASPGNGMSSETVLFDVHNVAEGGVDRYVARLAPLPDLYPGLPRLQPRAPAQVHGPRARPHRRSAPGGRVLRARHRMAAHAVSRDAPHRRRIAARHAAVRVRRLGDGRDAGATPRAAGRERERAGAAARDHARQPRPLVPRAAGARHERARPATRLPTLVLRVGAQRRVVPADRAHARVARREPAARRRAGAQLGRRASATCSTSTSSPPRCSTGRWRPSARARSTSRG